MIFTKLLDYFQKIKYNIFGTTSVVINLNLKKNKWIIRKTLFLTH